MTDRKPMAVDAWWSDEAVPDLSAVLTPGLGIDPAAFAAWLAPLLVNYRDTLHARRSLPARADELAYARTAVAALEAAEKVLARRAMPDRVAAHAFVAGHREGVDFRELCTRVRTDLALVRRLLRTAERKRAAEIVPPGRKGDAARDALLAGVVAQLRAAGLKAELARAVARDVLHACGVAVPVDPKRATKRGMPK